MAKQKKGNQNKKPTKVKAVPVSNQKWYFWLIGLLVLTFIAYIPMLRSEFLNYDDNLFITENPLIQNLSWENLSSLFSTFFHHQYGPLSMAIMSIEFSILGADPMPYKVVSVLWHLGNTALVFWLIRLLVSRWEIALITASLFGLHTLQVESVAWLSGSMKIGPYAFFFLAALIAYVYYYQKKTTHYYALSIGLFILACFSKEQAITLSAVVVSIDYLLGRSLLDKKVILEKIPFVLVSLIFAIVTMKTIPTNVNAEFIFEYSFFEKTLFAFYALGQYVLKTLIPINLSAFYTYPVQGALPVTFYVFPLISVFLGWLFLRSFKKYPSIAFGLLFFGINIFISIATQFTAYREVIMADRYMYLASIGFFLCIGFAYDWVQKNRPALKRISQIGIGTYLLLLLVLTFNQNKIWKSSVTLFSNVIENEEFDGPDKNPFLSPAYNNLGNALKAQGKMEEALNNFNKAVQANPNYYMAYINRGVLYLDQQKMDLALADLNKGIAANPGYENGYFNRAAVYLKTGKYELALQDYNQFIALNSSNPQAYYLRGFAKHSLKQYEAALADYNQAISRNNKDGNFFLYRAYTLDVLNRKQEAYQDMLNAQRMGVKIDPNYLQRLKGD